MAKWLDCRTAPSAEVVSPIDTIIMGGLAERWGADSARKPAGPPAPLAVTMATPIARQPIPFQKVFASISVSMPLLLCGPTVYAKRVPDRRPSRKRLQSAAATGEGTRWHRLRFFMAGDRRHRVACASAWPRRGFITTAR